MTRLEQLFFEEKFHPVEDRGKSMVDLLEIPLEKESKKRKTQSIKILLSRISKGNVSNFATKYFFAKFYAHCNSTSRYFPFENSTNEANR